MSGSAEIGQLMTGADQVAVDVPGPFGTELVDEDWNHRLVEDGQALRDLAGLQEHAALTEEARGDQIAVAIHPADLLDPTGGCDHSIRIRTAELRLDADQVEDIPVLGRFVGLVGEQACAAAHLTGACDVVAAQEEGDCNGHGHPCRVAGPLDIEVAPIGLLRDGDGGVDLAEPPV
ncbi:MAG: hypothetical protein ACSLFN_09610 [Candidatus Limnocylindrales bacterium]